jgi:uncharacterized protein YbjT (DUF2867 family)
MSSHTPLLIAVHGATGVQGSAVARRLLDDGHYVRAVARHPSRSLGMPVGCDPFSADVADVDALARAYAGADAVYVQLPLVFDETAIVQAERVVEALRREEVRRVVFNTGGPLPAEPVGVPYLDARVALARALSEGRFTATLIGPAGPYMENLAAPWSAPLVNDGVIAQPLPAELPLPWVALTDLAEHVAAAVRGPGHSPRLISGPLALTGHQAADALSVALERPVRWETIEPAEYEEMMRPFLGDAAEGLSRHYASAVPLPEPAPADLRHGRTGLGAWASTEVWHEAGLLAVAG